MICVAWIKAPGDITVSFLWDSERFPVVVIRDDQLTWKEYLRVFGSAAAVQYEKLAWENRIEWVSDKPIYWHKEQAGVYEITDRDLSKIDWETFGND